MSGGARATIRTNAR